MLAELETIDWDIILFSEAHAVTGKSTLNGGHVLYTSIDTNRHAGVGILLHSKHVKSNNKPHMISGRIMALDLTVNEIKIRAVAVYMPHCGYTQDEFDETYDQLRCISGKAQTQRRRLIIGGDFNSQINVGYRGNTM